MKKDRKRGDGEKIKGGKETETMGLSERKKIKLVVQEKQPGMLGMAM